jgi:hypothetical protein
MAQKTLQEQIAVDPARPRVVAECVNLIDEQVRAKGGVRGMTVRAAYATIKTLKRGFVTGVVEALLDDWLTKLEPYYVRWGSGASGSFSEYLIARSDEVAEDLLEVTDKRAETTKHTTAKKYYFKMRDKAKDNVVDAVPELARLIERHLEAAPQSAASGASA